MRDDIRGEKEIDEGEKEILKNKQLVPNNIERMLMKIITAMNFIGFPIEDYSIEDILLNDWGNINAIYEGTIKRYGNDIVRQKSYEFLISLFSKYTGRTLFDILEKIYGEEAEAFDTNLQVDLMKKIKEFETLAKELIIAQGIRDLMGD
jgi:hypothetical protein